jgi:hypothetical protein
MTNRQQTATLLRKLREDRDISDHILLDWILNNYLDGSQSVEALELFEMEHFDKIFEDNDQDIDDYNMFCDEKENN